MSDKKKEYEQRKRPVIERPAGWIPPNKRPQTPKPRYVRPEFSFDTIHGLPLKEVECVAPDKEEKVARRKEFDGEFSADGTTLVKEGMRAKFLKHLANNFAPVLKENLGLTDKEISEMASRGRVPKGFNVHHKLPLHVGGKNELGNLILIPLMPHDQLHHDVLDQQIANMKPGEHRTILLPASDEMIYDPKKFGYTRDNRQVEPNYETKVQAGNYSNNYLPEHIAEIRSRQKEEEQVAKQVSLFSKLKQISLALPANAPEPRAAATPPAPERQALMNKMTDRNR